MSHETIYTSLFVQGRGSLRKELASCLRTGRAIRRPQGRVPTNKGKLGKGYPVGTILQLFPFEAMAKRGGKFNKAGHGWEYFTLKPNAGPWPAIGKATC